ncbi:hypothetical protein PUR71_35930 [Streptomyces sp. SP17BM10]|nr:hypothetical protein [Streptomyces sp. SP17BM10]MEE1788247.1 hypothetical protein [Streptomyces sp. SP17BM10]
MAELAPLLGLLHHAAQAPDAQERAGALRYLEKVGGRLPHLPG